MADKDKPGGDTPKTPRRRRATTPAKAAAKARPPRKAKPKADDSIADVASASKPKAKPAPKPRSSKRTAAKTGAKRSRTAAAAAPPPAKGGSLRDSLDRLGDRVRGPWGAAAIAGGLAAAAALLSLRGSTTKPTDTAKPEKDQPAGDDAGMTDSETKKSDDD